MCVLGGFRESMGGSKGPLVKKFEEIQEDKGGSEGSRGVQDSLNVV